MFKSQRRKNADKAFWQVTAVMIAVSTLCGISFYAPQFLQQACAYIAAFVGLLWMIALLDRICVWLGWKYED